MNKYPLIKAIAIAGFSAGMLISATANAQFTVDKVPAIKSGFPLDMAQWISDPDKYSWHPANVRQGKHPDRPDGVVYIFKNKADADAWWNPVTNPTGIPDGVPDKAVAYMHWALDNDSGLFPGVMAITDDLDFQNSNCIMSSGFIIIGEDGKATKKTCGNPPASAKRFKLVILQADQPIDIIFNMETKGLTYYEYDENPTDPSLDVTGDIFRNYRYLMKVGNGTGTDTVGGARAGTRLAGIKVELGFSNLATGDFIESSNDETDGLAYEIRQCVEKRYWDIAFDHEIGETEYCEAQWREVFLPHEFATFSPGMYAEVDDARNPDAGYWDINPAGLVLPTLPKPGIDPTSPLIQPQFIESYEITDNYFDVAGNQAAGSNPPVSGNVFGYLMPYGVFADGDPGAIPMGIYKDDDGDPDTEGELYAWWDGSSPSCCYRWGIDGSNSEDHGAIGPDAWGLVSDTELAEMMARPLSETEVLDPPRYEVAYMDDLGGLNMDTFIKLTKDYNLGAHPTFTVRLTGQSVAAGAPGTEDGPWVATPADATAFEPDASVDTDTSTTSSDGGSSGSSLSWMTAGLLALGLLLRRKRF